MAKTYNVPEIKQRLAKHLREMVIRVAGDIEDLAVREKFVMDNLTKADGQFEITPPTDGATPIHGGAGIPPGQLGQEPLDPNAPPAVDPNPTQLHGSIDPNADTCPLCGQADQPGSCTCLNNAILGKNAMAGYSGTGQSLAMAEANPGANKEVTKQQPTEPVSGAVLPPEAGKKVKGGDDNKVKKNPLTKGAVPEAKPPSGKVPGGTATPPMASNTSKPAMAKAAMPANPQAQMKQHALAAAPVPGKMPMPMAPAPGAPLTHPGDMSRANAHVSALGGAFAPPVGKPPVSGLGLAPPKTHSPGTPGMMGPKPVSGLQLARSEKCVFCKKAEHAGTCNK